MSWRRFIVLVNGFGPQTATVTHMSAKAQRRGGGRSRIPDIVIDADREPERLNDLFAAMAGGKKRRKNRVK